MEETKPRRHWFRFSLRTLFVLVTVCAFGTLVHANARGLLLRWSIDWHLDQLKVGMTETEVVKIVGEPLYRTGNDLVYQNGLHDPYMIEFDSDKKLRDIW